LFQKIKTKTNIFFFFFFFLYLGEKKKKKKKKKKKNALYNKSKISKSKILRQNPAALPTNFFLN